LRGGGTSENKDTRYSKKNFETPSLDNQTILADNKSLRATSQKEIIEENRDKLEELPPPITTKSPP
jgi:hypothetical protein